jgi:hypothetical protein
MLDLTDPAAVRAEAERRQRLREQGARSFDESCPVSSSSDRGKNVTRENRDASIDEKTEQREVRKRFIVCGFRVYNLSQSRASKQSPGLPDLWIVRPAQLVQRRDGQFHVPGIALWWETKRQVGGRYSGAQREFAELCQQASVTWVGGDRYDAERWLVEQKLATIENGVLEPILQ